jgi:hypothetical protein
MSDCLIIYSSTSSLLLESLFLVAFLALSTTFHMLLHKNFCKRFLTEFAGEDLHFFLFTRVNILLIFLNGLFLDGLDSCSEILRGCLPVIRSLLKHFSTLAPALFFLLILLLLDNSCLLLID